MGQRIVPLIFLAVAVCMPAMASGQEEMSTRPTLRISKVRVEGDVAGQPQVKKFGLEDTLLVTVENWNQSQVKKLNNDKELDKANWLLKLDGIPLPGISAIAIDTEVRPGKAEFRFHLTRDSAINKDAWDELLRRPFQDAWVRPVRVGIEPQKEFSGSIEPLNDEDKVSLIVVAPGRLYPLLVFMLLVIVVLVLLGKGTSILRAKPDGVYSLGKAQMAWWFVIVLGSYLVLGILTYDWTNTISTSAVTLLGISATTALSATLIGNDKERKAKEAEEVQPVLEKQMETVGAKFLGATTATEAAVLNSSFLDVTNKLAQAKATPTRVKEKSKGIFGFFEDLISDNDGVSLHRLQNVIWTLVLGVTFAFSVAKGLSMPEFNATLLSLMGISSATYVGFKYPEK